MGRRFINLLADREEVDEIYQASGKQLRPNRNGNLYLQVQLSDRTGIISARMWNATNSVYRASITRRQRHRCCHLVHGGRWRAPQLDAKQFVVAITIEEAAHDR